MREAMRHIIYTISQSTVSPKAHEPDCFYHVALPINIACGVLLIAYGAYIAYRLIRKEKTEEETAK